MCFLWKNNVLQTSRLFVMSIYEKKHLQSHFFSYKMRVSYGGWVAQLVEQRIENPRVGGSIPSPATSRLSRVVFTTRDFLFPFSTPEFLIFFQHLG